MKYLLLALCLTTTALSAMEQFSDQSDSLCTIKCCLSKRQAKMLKQAVLWAYLVGFPLTSIYTFTIDGYSNEKLTFFAFYLHAMGWLIEPCVLAYTLKHLKNNIQINWRKKRSRYQELTINSSYSSSAEEE